MEWKRNMAYLQRSVWLQAGPFCVLAIACIMACASVRADQGMITPPVTMTSQQDLERTMATLHLQALRPGVDGMNKTAPNFQNNDESKAGPFSALPDPLILNNGKKVTSVRMWWKQRRKEIVEDFDRELYGRAPKHTPKVTWKVVSVTRGDDAGIPIITKVLDGHVDNATYPAIVVDISMTLTTPANATGPVPVILEFGFTRKFTPPAGFIMPPAPPGPTWQEQLLAKGWGWAIIDPTSFQADNGAGLTQGIIGLCNKGQPRGLEDWGTLRAWAWGADRAMDYFETDSSIDAKQVGIEGISRYGKATLLTMAYDQRFAIAFVGSSGEGGAKLWRRHWGEEEGNIASSGEYQWMCGNFLKYDGVLTPNDMPVDQHELIDLCAPRPVFISCGSPNVEGTWLDDHGMFMAAVAAGPVYRLLGKKDLSTDVMPAEQVGLLDGEIAWRQHSGGHTDGPNWPTFIEYASHYLHGPGGNP